MPGIRLRPVTTSALHKRIWVLAKLHYREAPVAISDGLGRTTLLEPRLNLARPMVIMSLPLTQAMPPIRRIRWLLVAHSCHLSSAVLPAMTPMDKAVDLPTDPMRQRVLRSL